MAVIANEDGVARLTAKLADAIRRSQAEAGATAPWALVGIRSRGDVLASRLAARVPVDHVGTLDITLYRDDLSEIGPQPVVRTSEIAFSLDGVHVVLVDDVLMTGRSVRAAIQFLMDLGRPRRVWLSVLVDRGGRELPIQPDHAALDLARPGAAVALARHQQVDVRLQPFDEQDVIVVSDAPDRPGVAEAGT